MEETRKELRLLKKKHGGFKQLFFGKMTIALLLLLVNACLLAMFFFWFEEYLLHFVGVNTVIGAVMVLYLLYKPMEPSMRATWLIIILTDPVFGSLLYLFLDRDIGHRLMRRRGAQIQEATNAMTTQDGEVLQALEQIDPGSASVCRFLNDYGGTLYRNTEVAYFPVGEDMLARLLEELEKAEKWIFMEYFIVDEGTMWCQILEVLARKAKQGVDVRVMYDGTVEFTLLPRDYPKMLEKLGIQCKVFSPVSPIVSTHYNFRDHRKITVIDGQTAFNGGINLSDEYINIGSRFGHWKDTAVMLKGEAVRGFTKLFLQMWNLDEKTPDYSAMEAVAQAVPAEGFVMPYGDDPLDDCLTGQRLYMSMINRATKTVDIVTPYLILDAEMENVLRFAASRKVRVRVLLPGIPDKYVPYALAKSHYRQLLDCGVEIYEYTPGFTHAKMVIADSVEAVVGTINFDYRSLYHHFECATWMYGCRCIQEICRDVEESMDKSRQVTLETLRHEKWHMKLTGFLLKGFAPLL